MKFAALFDWDGVIVDSSQFHRKSWDLLAAETGYVLPPGHFKKSFGMKNDVIIPEILLWTKDGAEIRRLSLRKEELYRELVRETGIEPLPGARAWLVSLRDRGVRCAIGSSTHRLNIETSLAVLGMADFFEVVISAEDVTRGKPDPQVFLAGARSLNTSPASCVVFEDALVGIEAAHRGGMKAVAVATTHPLEDLAAADLAVASLAELTVERVAGLFSETQPFS